MFRVMQFRKVTRRALTCAGGFFGDRLGGRPSARLATSIAGLLLAACFCPPATAQYLTDPTPSLTVAGGVTTLRKELSGYLAYGPSGADILFPPQTGTWNFSLSAFGLSAASFTHVTMAPRLVLDDHGTALSLYSLELKLNGATVFSGPANTIGLNHGSPWGGPYTNWVVYESGPLTVADSLVVTIRNTSATSGSDWLGIDAIAVNLHAVPEPSIAALFILGLALLVPGLLRRRKIDP